MWGSILVIKAIENIMVFTIYVQVNLFLSVHDVKELFNLEKFMLLRIFLKQVIKKKKFSYFYSSIVIHYAVRHVMLRFIGSNRSFVDYFWPCYLVKNVISDSLIKIENLIEMAAYIIDMWRTLQLTAYAGKCYVFRFINKIEVAKLQNKII